jgi:hypothetical protein
LCSISTLYPNIFPTFCLAESEVASIQIPTSLIHSFTTTPTTLPWVTSIQIPSILIS